MGIRLEQPRGGLNPNELRMIQTWVFVTRFSRHFFTVLYSSSRPKLLGAAMVHISRCMSFRYGNFWNGSTQTYWPLARCHNHKSPSSSTRTTPRVESAGVTTRIDFQVVLLNFFKSCFSFMQVISHGAGDPSMFILSVVIRIKTVAEIACKSSAAGLN